MKIQREAQDGSNWEYLCTLLKDLLTIPHDNLVGRMMWRLITRTANRVVTANMKEDTETLTNSDLLDLIGKKQILDEKYNAIREEDSKEEVFRQKIHELQDQLDLATVSQISTGVSVSSGSQTKVISDLIAQVSEYMNVKYMRDDPTYSKYFAMCESGVPLDEVIRLCRKDGVNEQVVRGPSIILTLKPELRQKVPSSVSTEPSSLAVSSVSDPDNPRNNPEYKKWFKLLDMNIPREHLELKMIAEGIDPSILDYKEPTPVPSASPDPSTDPNNPRNNPALKKWFKLLDMGIPKEHLIVKIEAEGLDPSFILNAEPLGSQPQPEPVEREVKPTAKSEIKQSVKKEVYNPPKAKRNPETKLKSLFWEPVVGDALRESVWESLHDDKVPLDLHELCSLFRAKDNTVINQVGGSASDPSVKKPTELVQLITDEKRLRNVGMSIARLKMSYETLREDILRVDDTVLTQDMLRMLIENAPTEAEVTLVQGYTGNLDLLSEVDRFFKVLSNIPQLAQRLKNLQLRQVLRDDLSDMKLDLESYQLAMDRLLKSSKLTQLLEAILAIGNYMNG